MSDDNDKKGATSWDVSEKYVMKTLDRLEADGEAHQESLTETQKELTATQKEFIEFKAKVKTYGAIIVAAATVLASVVSKLLTSGINHLMGGDQ